MNSHLVVNYDAGGWVRHRELTMIPKYGTRRNSIYSFYNQC